MPSEDFEICIGQRRIRGLCWNPKGKITLIALHGWLDNAASFAAMAPHLSNIRLLAPDLAGQGLSDPRDSDGNYDLPSELRDLQQILQQLGTSQPVNLLGHSRGAVICGLYAAVFPQQVKRLMMIDAAEPFRSSLAELPDGLATSIEQLQSYAQRAATSYPSREAALQARMQSITPVSQQGAEHLAQRALYQHEKGFSWRADQRLKGRSGFRLTQEMRADFYCRISAPTLLLEPLKGMILGEPAFAGAGEFIPGLVRKSVPGGHHCHLDDCPQQVAEIAEDWFG